MRTFELYAVGFCSNYTHRGGWAVVSTRPVRETWDSGRKESTVGKEMQLTAIAHALSLVKTIQLGQDVEQVVIISGSRWAIRVALGMQVTCLYPLLVGAIRSLVKSLGKGVEIKWQLEDLDGLHKVVREEIGK